MDVRGVKLNLKKKIKIPKNNNSLVIIQWSCDPPPEDEVDKLLDTRLYLDKIGKSNL